MQENKKRSARGPIGAKTTRRPPRISLRIAITLPAALHLEAKRKARSLSMNFSEYMRSLIRKDLEVRSISLIDGDGFGQFEGELDSMMKR